MLQINQESIDTACNEMDRWADNLREHVDAQSNSVRAHIEGMTDFQGEAATAFRGSFDDMVSQIRSSIDSISNEQIRGMRSQLQIIKDAIMGADGDVASSIRR